MNERKFAELLIKVAEKQELTQEELQKLVQKAGEIEQQQQEQDNEYIPDSMNRVVQVSKNSSGELEVESLGFAYEQEEYKKAFSSAVPLEQVQKLAGAPEVETTQVYKQETEERTKQLWKDRFTVRAFQEVEETSGKKHKVEAHYFQPKMRMEEIKELLKPFKLESEHEEGLHSLVTETFSFEQAVELKSYLEKYKQAEVFVESALVPELGWCGEAFMSEHSSIVVTFEVNQNNREGLSFPVYMNFVKPEVEAEREQYKQELIQEITQYVSQLELVKLEELAEQLGLRELYWLHEVC